MHDSFLFQSSGNTKIISRIVTINERDVFCDLSTIPYDKFTAMHRNLHSAVDQIDFHRQVGDNCKSDERPFPHMMGCRKGLQTSLWNLVSEEHVTKST